eukprot:1249408-Alexandrium_andersonii.AAC.1
MAGRLRGPSPRFWRAPWRYLARFAAAFDHGGRAGHDRKIVHHITSPAQPARRPNQSCADLPSMPLC